MSAEINRTEQQIATEGLRLWHIGRSLWQAWIDGDDESALQTDLRDTLDRIDALAEQLNGAGE